MIAMSPTMTLKGTMKFSLKKALIGGDLTKSSYTGPGELLLAPSSIGDITIIKLAGHETWSVGKDAFLACTQGIVTEYKSQGIGKAMFSGEGMFVYKISGQGILWCTSFGAIIRKDVSLLRFLFKQQRLCANREISSFKKTKSTLSITAIWLRGTVNTCWSAWRRGVSCRIYMRVRGWCVSSRDRGRCSCRRGIRRRFRSGWLRTVGQLCSRARSYMIAFMRGTFVDSSVVLRKNTRRSLYKNDNL